MARRTLLQMIASVQRLAPGANLTPGEIHEALSTANKNLHAAFAWPWAYREFTINVPGTYSTGTISIASGATAVMGVGTVFPADVTGYRIRCGNANLDYIVSARVSDTQLTLAQAYGGAAISGVGFSLYRDTFTMPDDFNPGHDLMITNPQLRYRIQRKGRYFFEKQMTILRPMATAYPLYYTDGEPVLVSGDYRMTVRFCPPVSAQAEYRLTYRGKPAELTTVTSVTQVPDSFDDVLELMAEVWLRRRHQMPGLPEAQAQAEGKLKLLRNMIALDMTDVQPTVSESSADSSFSQWGLTITPTP